MCCFQMNTEKTAPCPVSSHEPSSTCSSNFAFKVILSSGYSVDGEAQTIMNRGCKGFIQKPFRILDLSRKIREILEPTT